MVIMIINARHLLIVVILRLSTKAKKPIKYIKTKTNRPVYS